MKNRPRIVPTSSIKNQVQSHIFQLLVAVPLTCSRFILTGYLHNYDRFLSRSVRLYTPEKFNTVNAIPLFRDSRSANLVNAIPS